MKRLAVRPLHAATLTLCAAIWAVPATLVAQSEAVPRIHPTDPHRLVKNGATWFPTGFYGASMTMASGDSEWNPPGNPALCTDLPPVSPLPPPATSAAEVAFRCFADKLSAAKLNYFRAWINWGAIPVGAQVDDWDYSMVHPYQRSKEDGAIDGGNKFDLGQFNPEYFSLLQREVDYAAKRGLVAQIVLFDCFHVSPPSGTHPDLRPPGLLQGAEQHQRAELDDHRELDESSARAVATHQKAFVREVMAKIGDRPNIVWETCNEDLTKNVSNPTVAVTPWDEMIAAEIHAHDPLPHLVMPLDLPEHRTVAGHRTPAQQSQETVAAMHERLRSPQFGWQVPLITDNDCCQPPLANYGSIPREEGLGGLTAGAHSNFFVDNLSENYDLMSRSDITLGMKEVGYVQKFLTDLGVNLVGMIPSDHLVTGGTGAWAYARATDEFIVYLRAAGTAPPSVTVTSLPATYTAKWFNPRDGSSQPATGGPIFTQTATSDWVLRIVSTTSGYAGYHDGIDCNATFGWAWNPNQPTTRLNVDLYDGTTLLGTTSANRFRQDLLNAGIGDGIHGFSFSLPASVRDGATHTITAKFGGTGNPLSTTPKTIQCAGNPSVSIAATDPTASESAGNPGQFTLTRTGNTSSPLTVTLTRAGTAVNGTDYSSIPTTQSFGTGQSTRVITVSPIDDANVETTPETVVLTVAAGAGYTVGSPPAATVTITNNDFVACVPSATRLCLFGGRFEATLTATANGNTYIGQAVSSGAAPGWFWLFSPQVPEVRVKVVDPGTGTLVASYGASTDVATTITVTDLANNRIRTHSKPAGSFCGGSDGQSFVNLFPSEPESNASAGFSAREAFTCAANNTTTCLLNGRFQVRVKLGSTYQAAITATGQSGTYGFASPGQADVFVNLLDGTGLNGKYWVYFGSLTNQPYTVEVADSVTGISKSYSRTAAQAFCGGGDSSAF